MGKEKVSLVIADGSLLQRTIHLLDQLGQEIIVVLASGQDLPAVSSSQTIRTATDAYRGKGPLVGIYSGLKVSRDDYNLVVACDMPFLSIDLLRYMVSLAPGFDIVIPRIGDLMEPLHAIYSKSCLPHIEDMMRGGSRLQPVKLLDRVKVRYVEESEINKFDPQHLSFFNVNTPADLEKARELVDGERHRTPDIRQGQVPGGRDSSPLEKRFSSQP